MSLTRKQILRRYDQLIRQCFKDMEGGLSYGMDWPTLKVTFPERYAELKQLQQQIRVMPQ
jgi:hypothetical protein